ncbi:hypothetical protein AWC02_15345 [Mycolicibacter engbaekii]|uniref:DUF1023 domain-containing protein n=1 Tax=Mycolicibacter engbaekii TaxID=188915 RepID=A0A1X1TFP2_9MYCO|nr:alpha/beta hydrolase [Mycolicibacter engbaekii]ORV43374.1 hypothetical protein AWC02_15345 [Mycolicibacter engbaekii]
MTFPTLSELRAATWDHLRTNATAWRKLGHTWENAFTEVHNASLRPGGTDWTGAGAEAFQDRAYLDLVKVRGPADMAEKAAKIAERGADAQDSNKRSVLDAVDEAERADFTVGEFFSVTDTRTYYSSAAEQAERESAAQDHADFIQYRVQNLVNHEGEIARTLATATAGLHEFSFGDEGADGGAGRDALSPGMPPDDPQQFTQWWNHLTESAKDAAYDRDHFIGNHPGMPFDDKTHYNERHLTELMAGAQSDVDRLQASRDQLALTPGGNLATLTKLGVLDSQLQDAKHNLDGYRAVQQAMQADPNGPPHYLGFVDDRGHAAVSIGNPDNAKRSATFLPGTGQDLATFQGSADKSAAMYEATMNADRSLQSGDVSVTTWMGYDRPMDLLEAAHTSYAHNGATALDEFQSGLRASHNDALAGGPSINTVIGHSYGSTELGAAALDGHHLDANNVVAVGSPGMLADHASDLDLAPGARVFATRAENDIIGVVTGATLGPDPMLSSFGGTPFEASPGAAGAFDRPTVGAHSSYWDNMSNSALINLGRIIAGRTDVTPPTFTP